MTNTKKINLFETICDDLIEKILEEKKEIVKNQEYKNNYNKFAKDFIYLVEGMKFESMSDKKIIDASKHESVFRMRELYDDYYPLSDCLEPGYYIPEVVYSDANNYYELVDEFIQNEYGPRSNHYSDNDEPSTEKNSLNLYDHHL
tara:strand:- start:418 stop:852 length:435 start_codon:yes stop_codon:yes gene_type:complete